MFILIIYQFAIKFPLIADCEVLKNPTILTTVQSVQFEKLLVKPLYQVTFQNVPIEEWMIILDSLVHVDIITTQTKIIHIFAISISEHTILFC